MAVNVSQWVWENAPPDLSPGELNVLLALANHAKADGTDAYPSQATLAFECRTTDRNVRRHLRRLITHGCVECKQWGKKQTNRYRVVMTAQSVRTLSESVMAQSVRAGGAICPGDAAQSVRSTVTVHSEPSITTVNNKTTDDYKTGKSSGFTKSVRNLTAEELWNASDETLAELDELARV